jgi:hypothetical protein
MYYQEIFFNETDDPFLTRLGGAPLLPSTDAWPHNPQSGSPLILLASLRNSFLAGLFPQFVIPDDYCLSVFVCLDHRNMDCINSLSVQSQAEVHKKNNGSSRVLLHKCATQPCNPPANVPDLIPMRQMTLGNPAGEEEDPAMPDRGLIIPKIGGIPGWAQDPIVIPDHTYVMQLDDYSIGKLSSAHKGIFEHDLGFLFLKSSFEPGEAGAFFIQYT